MTNKGSFGSKQYYAGLVLHLDSEINELQDQKSKAISHGEWDHVSQIERSIFNNMASISVYAASLAHLVMKEDNTNEPSE